MCCAGFRTTRARARGCRQGTGSSTGREGSRRTRVDTGTLRRKEPAIVYRMVPTSDIVLTQLRKGVVEYCVLACLRSGPAYGLELAERLGSDSSLLTSEGTLYPLLSRVRQQGWVTTTQVP